MTFKKRLTRKSLVCCGTDICSRPEGETEKRTLFESGFLRTITSPNSRSVIIMWRSLELSQNLFELGVISVLAREDDRCFGVRGSFEGLYTTVVNSFGFFDGFELILETHTDRIDISLDPDERRRIAGGAQNFGKFSAIFFGIITALEDERRAGFCDLINEEKNELSR